MPEGAAEKDREVAKPMAAPSGGRMRRAHVVSARMNIGPNIR